MPENLSRDQGQKEAFFVKSNYSKVSSNINKTDAIPEPPIGSFADTIGGLAAAHPNKLGGAIGSQLMAAMTGHMYSELQEKKSEVTSLRGLLNTTKDQLHDWETKAKVLEKRIEFTDRNTLSGNILITIGLLIFGLGFNLLEKESLPLSCIVPIIVIGLLATLSGWAMGFGGKK